MGPLFGTFIVLCLLPIARLSWVELGMEISDFSRSRFWWWLGRGFLVPLALWLLLNAGLLFGYPPIMTDLLQPSGGLLRGVMRVAIVGIALIGSFWLAMSYAWFSGVILVRSPAPRREELRDRCVWHAVFLLPLTLGAIWWLGWPAAGFAALIYFFPLARDILPLIRPLETAVRSGYGKALAQMRFGHYDRAELTVIDELEQNEEDFDGWMMLAELYAVHFGDLPAADRTVRELCDQPATTISECAVALHRLADWHLKIGKDPVAARDALEGICRKYPGTHLDRMARLRISRLPADREALLRDGMRPRIRLPSQNPPVESAQSREEEMAESDARAHAESYVQVLARDPSDVSARTRYAGILTRHLGCHDDAIEQLRQLLQMPDQPEESRVEWLKLAAEIELRQRKNLNAAKRYLEELVREYPQSPHAFPAQRELSLLTMELKLRTARERRERAHEERMRTQRGAHDRTVDGMG